ncbi:FxsA family protein [Brevibacillus ginsengisoli]|uniref:FxsA family protein n=1 Tax=Brevibacillus ginsengisoli TaxID=363854 RepID=UPI003CF89571
MFRILLVLFIIVPAIELWGLISVGKVIGPWWTVLLVIFTSVLGAWLAKKEGLQVLRNFQMQTSRGQMPTDSIIDGILVMIGAILLITPGFVTDVFGIFFLIPYTRMIIRYFFKKWLWNMMSTGKIQFFFRR